MPEQNKFESTVISRLTYINDVRRLPPWCEVRVAQIIYASVAYVPAKEVPRLIPTEIKAIRKTRNDENVSHIEELSLQEIWGSVYNYDTPDADKVDLVGDIYLSVILAAAPRSPDETYNFYSIFVRDEDIATVMEVLLSSIQPAVGMYDYADCSIDNGSLSCCYIALARHPTRVHFIPGNDGYYGGGSEYFIAPLAANIPIYRPDTQEQMQTAQIDSVSDSSCEGMHTVTTDDYEDFEVDGDIIRDIVMGDNCVGNIPLFISDFCEYDDISTDMISDMLGEYIVVRCDEYAINEYGERQKIGKELFSIDYAWTPTDKILAGDYSPEEYSEEGDEA